MNRPSVWILGGLFLHGLLHQVSIHHKIHHPRLWNLFIYTLHRDYWTRCFHLHFGLFLRPIQIKPLMACIKLNLVKSWRGIIEPSLYWIFKNLWYRHIVVYSKVSKMRFWSNLDSWGWWVCDSRMSRTKHAWSWPNSCANFNNTLSEWRELALQGTCPSSTIQ